MHHHQSCHPGSRPVEGEHRRSLENETRSTEASVRSFERTNKRERRYESGRLFSQNETEKEERARIRPNHTAQEQFLLTTLLTLEATLLEASLLTAVCCCQSVAMIDELTAAEASLLATVASGAAVAALAVEAALEATLLTAEAALLVTSLLVASLLEAALLATETALAAVATSVATTVATAVHAAV